MIKKSIGLWVLVALLLLPEVLSMEVEKMSYVEGEIIRVDEEVSYCGKTGYSFVASLDCNKIIGSSEKLIHVSDGKSFGTVLNLGVFGFVNLFIVKIVRRCFKIFI